MSVSNSGVFIQTLPSLYQVGMSCLRRMVKVKTMDDKNEQEWKKKKKTGLG